MSFKKLPRPPRDVTKELTQAFQISNLCRELAKTKIIPGTKRRLGARRSDAPDSVAEDPSGYMEDKDGHSA